MQNQNKTPEDLVDGIKNLKGHLDQKLDEIGELTKNLPPAYKKAFNKMGEDIKKGVASGDMDMILEQAKKATAVQKNYGAKNNR